MRKFVQISMCLAVLALPALAARTSIQDTLFRADGGTCSGYLAIYWNTFTNVSNQLIQGGSIQSRVVNGVVNVSLEPGTYRVEYQIGPVACTPTTEIWVVPASGTPLTIAMVRSLNPPPPGTSIALSSLQSGGATLGQCLLFGGTLWGPGACVASVDGRSGVVTGVFDNLAANTLTDRSTPSNPTSGFTKVYTKAGTLCSLNPAGAESCTGAAGATLIDYTKHWELNQVVRNGAGGITLYPAAGTAPWNAASGTITYNTRSADSNFQFYLNQAAPGGGSSGGAEGDISTQEWYRQANTLLHVRVEPVTSTNARYVVGFSDANIATVTGSDNPTANSAFIGFSTTTGAHDFYCVVGNGATSAATDTGIAWAAGTAYELEVDLTASNVVCKINGTGTTVTTNLPATSSGMYGGYMAVAATSGAATTQFRWDRLYLQSDN